MIAPLVYPGGYHAKPKVTHTVGCLALCFNFEASQSASVTSDRSPKSSGWYRLPPAPTYKYLHSRNVPSAGSGPLQVTLPTFFQTPASRTSTPKLRAESFFILGPTLTVALSQNLSFTLDPCLPSMYG